MDFVAGKLWNCFFVCISRAYSHAPSAMNYQFAPVIYNPIYPSALSLSVLLIKRVVFCCRSGERPFMYFTLSSGINTAERVALLHAPSRAKSIFMDACARGLAWCVRQFQTFDASRACVLAQKFEKFAHAWQNPAGVALFKVLTREWVLAAAHRLLITQSGMRALTQKINFNYQHLSVPPSKQLAHHHSPESVSQNFINDESLRR